MEFFTLVTSDTNDGTLAKTQVVSSLHLLRFTEKISKPQKTPFGTNEEGTQFSDAFDKGNEMIMYHYANFLWRIKRFLNIGSEAVLKKSMKVVDQFVYNLIKSKIEKLHNS
ncbi:hypothetical protein DVH24_022661 [Malus domestica]|uniref:Uncharacterized protein n=1 Tax=Malus domestica TaxID=3750 RepID=A0A498KLZ8_MALDO|nr:hypothetical protein DVH24_022661 [Malus domestica]